MFELQLEHLVFTCPLLAAERQGILSSTPSFLAGLGQLEAGGWIRVALGGITRQGAHIQGWVHHDPLTDANQDRPLYMARKMARFLVLVWPKACRAVQHG